jgi:hypothetical protein
VQFRFDHLSDEGDAIGITFFKSKTKQEGENKWFRVHAINNFTKLLGMDVKDPKHCYANPFKPAVCLFVALGVYLACNSGIPNLSLFPGSKQKVHCNLDKTR